MDRRRRLFVGQLLALAACDVSPSTPRQPTAKPNGGETNAEIAKYGVSLELDIAAKTFRAEAELTLAPTKSSELVLDAVDLAIDSVACDGATAKFVTVADKLTIDLPGGARVVKIAYAGTSSEGLRIHDDHAFTGFDTRRWLPCDFSPGRRATIDITVKSMTKWKGVGSGDTLEASASGASTHFSLAAPYPAYLFGFAVGDFSRWTAKAGALTFDVYATRRTPIDAAGCLSVLDQMAEFFQEKTGIVYPFKTFSVVLAKGARGQEKAAFAILGDDWIYEWLADEREDWLFAHELSHSWWGNLVTCSSWSHFWLNEAFATAMTAFYKERRWGLQEYDRERGLARRRVDRMSRAGKSRPLELPAGASSSDAAGGWSYAYGFELVHDVRARLGEERFYAAMKKYLGAHKLAGVTGDDFLDAFAEGDAKLRAELADRIRKAPPAPPPEPSLEKLLEEAAKREDPVARFVAIDKLADRCSEKGQGCEKQLRPLAGLENDSNRAVAASIRRARRAPRAQFWKKRRRGANLFDIHEDLDRLLAARDAGIEFVRLAPNKWKSNSRDFLFGNTESFTGIPPLDAKELVRVLDAAREAEMKVVLTTLSLPGARWRQQNGNADDLVLWGEDTQPGWTGNTPAQPTAARFWRELVNLIGGHEAIVGYDVLNEPRPEALGRIFEASNPKHAAWVERARGTNADLNRFYQRIVAAIRSVDPVTPIVLESSMDASAASFAFLEPVDDDNVLYSFHLYEPWLYTSHKNNGKWKYPGPIPVDEEPKSPKEDWNAARLAKAVEPVVTWAKKHKIAAERILVGELGCFRKAPGAEAYLEDAVSLVESRGWHWAFYSFREDEWDGMDYEMGTTGKKRKDNPLWSTISSRLKKPGR